MESTIRELISIGYLVFATGGALGFDTLAAETVLRFREHYPKIRLFLILPCPEQTRGWNISDIEKYEAIKLSADDVLYTSSFYYKGCMFKRNRRLVDMSSVCVSYLRKSTGGTAYTVKYARSKGITVKVI